MEGALGEIGETLPKHPMSLGLGSTFPLGWKQKMFPASIQLVVTAIGSYFANVNPAT